jgi:hypothetical protein
MRRCGDNGGNKCAVMLCDGNVFWHGFVRNEQRCVCGNVG